VRTGERIRRAPRRPASRRGLSDDSPLLGGDTSGGRNGSGYDPRSGELDLPVTTEPAPSQTPDERQLRELIPPAETGRQLDDWGRSQRIFDLIEPLLDFYYRVWFRVDVDGIENVPAEGGALITSNHSGALPPDAPMIMQAIRREHSRPRPLYMLGEHWFKGYPGVSALTAKIGLVAAHPANAQRLLAEEERLALVFPEGVKATRKLYWQRYKLRRFGRGGFVRTAIRAQVPIVPVAVVGAEEAMPIFAHVPLLKQLTGLPYFPINHAFPHLGLAAAVMYLPAKFRIEFLEPIETSHLGPDDAEDPSLVQSIADDVRGRIQTRLQHMLQRRSSVWFG
jgi:1-acyl-sn-glycerol-3-phosphate acyltransferase